VQEERWNRLMELQAQISADKLARKVGRQIEVLVDHVEGAHAVARSSADAPEIDGVVHIAEAHKLRTGELVQVEVTGADEYDLHALPLDR
jgi:ribosomal protein S12 methylthiotransferase